MRISELSARSGVSVATLKYYLREGLLHAGLATSATTATYDESHLERVRLIRALIDSGGLSVAAARRVTDALDTPPPARHDLLGVAHGALSGGPISPEAGSAATAAAGGVPLRCPPVVRAGPGGPRASPLPRPAPAPLGYAVPLPPLDRFLFNFV